MYIHLGPFGTRKIVLIFCQAWGFNVQIQAEALGPENCSNILPGGLSALEHTLPGDMDSSLQSGTSRQATFEDACTRWFHARVHNHLRLLHVMRPMSLADIRETDAQEGGVDARPCSKAAPTPSAGCRVETVLYYCSETSIRS